MAGRLRWAQLLGPVARSAIVSQYVRRGKEFQESPIAQNWK